MLEFITDSEHVPWSLKVEYCKIATQQLDEDDSSLGMPRVLSIRILLEEMKYVCGEDGANWDWQERSLKLYPILLKILYTMDLKGEEKLDERMRPHKKIMALAFVSHMVQLVIERQLNEFKRVWESQVYAELKETPQGKMDGVRDELERLDEIGQRLLEIERINTDKKTTEKFDLDTFGGDGPLSPGKQLQDNLNSTDELKRSGKNSRITGTHFEDSVNELLVELKAYYKRAKVALGPTFLHEASMDISHEKYSPNLDEDKILIRADKDLERNLESMRGGKDPEVDDDSEDEFESAPKPVKKAAPKLKAKPAPRAPAKAKAAPPVAADSPLPKAKGQKRAARQIEDSPGACVFSPEPAPKPKKIAAKKRVVKDESEDEFAFDDDEPAAAPAPRAARGGGRGKKAVNYAAIAGSDSEEDEWANSGDESDGFVDSD